MEAGYFICRHLFLYFFNYIIFSLRGETITPYLITCYLDQFLKLIADLPWFPAIDVYDLLIHHLIYFFKYLLSISSSYKLNRHRSFGMFIDVILYTNRVLGEY